MTAVKKVSTTLLLSVLLITGGMVGVVSADDNESVGNSYDRELPVDASVLKYNSEDDTVLILFAMSDGETCVTRYTSLHLRIEKWHPELNTCPVDRPLTLLMKVW